MTEILKAIILPILSALGGAIAGWIVATPRRARKKDEDLHRRLEATEEGVKSLLRAEIQKEYIRICDPDVKFVKPYEKNNVSYLYKSYKGLGGDEYVSELYQQIMDKPVKE